MRAAFKKFLPLAVVALVFVFNLLFLSQLTHAEPVSQVSEAPEGECTSLLPNSWCSKNNGDGIFEIIHLVVRILVVGVTVVGTIGIIWCGFLWLSARDNEGQVATAKKRLIEIVIGLVIFGLAGLLVELFLPGGDTSGFLVIVNNIRTF